MIDFVFVNVFHGFAILFVAAVRRVGVDILLRLHN